VVCKTIYTGSNPVPASKIEKMNREGREVLTGTFESSKDKLRIEPSELIITKLVKRVFKNKKIKT
jgi:hypothetical protein